jgi:AraC-like DNA-binding protein
MKTKKSAKFTIETKSYTSQFHVIDYDLVLTEREQTYRQSKQIDCYGSQWCLIFTNLEPRSLFLRSGVASVELKGPSVVFVAPFDIVEWQLQKLTFKWKVIMSSIPLPMKDCQTRLLSQFHIPLPQSREEVFQLILRIQEEGIPIIEQKTSSAIALKLKNYLRLHYRENKTINEAAKKLKISRVVLTRAFTRAYGFSPITYRHRCRLFEAIHIFRDMNITDATLSVGYTDPGQLITQFKKYLDATPKQYSSGKTLFNDSEIG